jgi:hypothetical protein
LKIFKLLLFFEIIICFVSTNTFGQVAKKTIKYVDLKGNYISEKKYNSYLKDGFLSKPFENYATIDHHLYMNTYEGKLTPPEDAQVKLMIEKIVAKEIDINKTILIHLYNKNDEQLQHDINYKRYWNWLKKNPNRIESYLIGNKDSGIVPNPEKHVYVDSYNFFYNTFFKKTELDYNHVVIKPDGTYKLYHGNYDILGVLDGAF